MGLVYHSEDMMASPECSECHSAGCWTEGCQKALTLPQSCAYPQAATEKGIVS